MSFLFFKRSPMMFERSSSSVCNFKVVLKDMLFCSFLGGTPPTMSEYGILYFVFYVISLFIVSSFNVSASFSFFPFSQNTDWVYV